MGSRGKSGRMSGGGKISTESGTLTKKGWLNFAAQKDAEAEDFKQQAEAIHQQALDAKKAWMAAPTRSKAQKAQSDALEKAYDQIAKQEVDLSDMRKNPIPFVGVGEDKRLATIFEDLTIQPKYESDVEVKISELKTLQAFVLQSGIDTPRSWDGSVRPFVIQFEGEKYLIDGNHRVAKAMLDGHKTIRVDISYQVLKN